MTHRTVNSRHALESCTFQLHTWKPFHLQTLTKTLESDLPTQNPTTHGVLNKRPCLSDRTTTFSIETLDMSKLTLLDDERASQKREKFRWIARKRRRRGSRSVSGRSSDRSGTRRCSIGGGGGSVAYGTCSDFLVAAGTDSSGEFFVNGDMNWASDVSDKKNSRRERKEGRESGGGGGEKEGVGNGGWHVGAVEERGNESGYGSEPGYRGDAEFGYGDEFDEEEEEGRVLFWGEQFGDTDCKMEMVGENNFAEQKSHHRFRRKKHEWRMVDPARSTIKVTVPPVMGSNLLFDS